MLLSLKSVLYFKSVVLEMFVRMVVFFLFRLGYAQRLNDENYRCEGQENCIKFCCSFENAKNFCDQLLVEYRSFSNSTLSADSGIKFCQKVQFIDELNSEVNDPDM